jgi:hypothetical protein
MKKSKRMFRKYFFAFGNFFLAWLILSLEGLILLINNIFYLIFSKIILIETDCLRILPIITHNFIITHFIWKIFLTVFNLAFLQFIIRWIFLISRHFRLLSDSWWSWEWSQFIYLLTVFWKILYFIFFFIFRLASKSWISMAL